jgi:hypothetical protein
VGESQIMAKGLREQAKVLHSAGHAIENRKVNNAKIDHNNNNNKDN